MSEPRSSTLAGPPPAPGRVGVWHWVAVAVLVLVGAVTVFVAGGMALPTARVVGGNLPVAAGATDPLDVGANNSLTLKANRFIGFQRGVAVARRSQLGRPA